MKNDLTCAVVGDLLPAYAEHLTAPETNEAVERHLAGCPDCAAKLSAMRAPEPEPEPEETAREVDYLKKVKRRGWLRVTLAIVLTLAVLLGALAAKVFVIGSPASADTMAVRTWTAGGQLWVEVTSSVSANAWWGWDTEVENGTVYITAREVIVSPIHPSAYGKIGVPLEGVEEVYLCGRLIWQDGAAITPAVQALYEARTPYIGDNSAVGALLQELGRWYGGGVLSGYTVSLQTASQPYGLTLDFTGRPEGLSDSLAVKLNSEMERLSPLLLALIDNLEEVRWMYLRPDGITQSQTVTLEEVNAALPAVVSAYNADRGTDWEAPESVKDYAASAAALQQLAALSEYGFGSVFYAS